MANFVTDYLRPFIASNGADNRRVNAPAPRRMLIGDIVERVGPAAARYGEDSLGLRPGTLTPLVPTQRPSGGTPSEPPNSEGSFPGSGDNGGIPNPFSTGGGGGVYGTGGYDPLGFGGDCPGLFNVKIGGQCVDFTDAAPGGDPMITGQTTGAVQDPPSDGFGAAVKGMYGVGLIPRVETRLTRSCPRGMVLGKDGVCYDKRRLRKDEREWNPGMKPLLTGGERAAIAKANRAAGKLITARKSLKRVAKAFDKC